MDMQAFVREEEVMKMNMELAEKRDFTVDFIENLPDGVRAELIDGRVFYFAAPTTKHQRLAGELYFAIRQYISKNRGTCEVFFSPIGVKLAEDNKNHLEPDIIVVCDSDKMKEDGCHGAPDLVIEIAPKSTSRRDYGIKMLKYRTAGVKEYWIVDPVKETVMVFWFEDEEQNYLYSIRDEIEFHIFPDLIVKLETDLD